MIIGIVATVLLLIAFALDGLFDWMDFDFLDGVVGPSTIFAFVAVFGYTGALVTHNSDFEFLVVVIIATIVGLLGAGAVGLVMKYLRNSESGFVDDESIVGKTASVVLSIPAKGYGKVLVNNSGHVLEMAASSSEPIARGTQVVIKNIQGSGTVTVELPEINLTKSTNE
ncbi:MAG: NfeD family protein [Enterococcus sp.]|nr:NfeD family protein [Enterococcus sp.]